MARRIGSTCSRCRREGDKLYLKGDKCFTAKCPVARRPFPPGQHGPTTGNRPTPYGIQLREKQKAKNTYGILERQFRNYFEKASTQTGNTREYLVQMLETRLDNVVYRMGFAKSRAFARQLAGHGHVTVNGKKVTIPSFQVRPGDVVALATRISKSKVTEGLAEALEKRDAPSWVHVDAAAMSGKVLHKPAKEDLKQNFDPTLIVEFYSR